MPVMFQNTTTKLREIYSTYNDKEDIKMNKSNFWNGLAIVAALGSAFIGAVASDKKQKDEIEKSVNKYLDTHPTSRKEEKES